MPEDFALIARKAPVALALCDAAHRFIAVNEAYAARFGLAPEAVAGRPIAEVLGDEAYAAIRPYVERALRGESATFEIDVPYRELGLHRMRVTYEPVAANDGSPRFIACVLDVSDRHRADQALQEAQQRKDAFIATLGHELRNPLAAIQNAVALIKLPRADAAIIARAVGVLERQLRQMTRLIDDLLDLSRIARGKLSIEPVPVEVEELVRRAAETCQPFFEQRGQSLTLELPATPLPVRADPARIVQVLGNLLHNAAKYSPEGAPVRVRLEGDATQVRITVEDRGAGLSAEWRERIFEPFVQAAERTHGGLGIGLTLARDLVQLHGGTLNAHSDGPGTGSRFVIELPRAVSEG